LVKLALLETKPEGRDERFAGAAKKRNIVDIMFKTCQQRQKRRRVVSAPTDTNFIRSLYTSCSGKEGGGGTPHLTGFG